MDPYDTKWPMEHQWVAKRGPQGRQGGPKEEPNGSTGGQEAPRGSPNGPKGAQEEAKIPPR